MLGNISLVILREIINKIDDYQSIINLKLINKRIFKLINNDIVIQRYYLKLKYNLIINDEDLFSYIKLLDSKVYSKLIERRTFNKNRPFLLVNPKDDTFILITSELDQRYFSYASVYSCQKVCNEIYLFFRNCNKRSFDNFVFSQGYITLNLNVSDFIRNKKSCIFGATTDHTLYFLELTTSGGSIIMRVSSETYNEKILSLLKEM